MQIRVNQNHYQQNTNNGMVFSIYCLLLLELCFFELKVFVN